jgi:hypothetical protein
MTGTVELYPPRLSAADEFNRIRNAMPVYGNEQWLEHARMVSWLLGRGSTLVQAPGSADGIDVSSSQSYRYWVHPHEQNHVRVWLVGIATADTLSDELFGNIIISWGGSASASVEWRLRPGTKVRHPTVFEVWETIDPPSSTARQATVTVDHDAASPGIGTPYVTAISCYEIPRVALDNYSSVIVPDDRTLQSGRLIYQDVGDSKSLHTVATAMTWALTHARRACLFSFYTPVSPVITSTSFVDEILADAVSVMPRHKHNGETTRDLTCSVYASVSGAGEGEVRFSTTTPTGSLTLTVDDTVAGWYHGTLALNTEDPSRLSIDGGLRGGVRNAITVEARRTTASSITVKGICINEID